MVKSLPTPPISPVLAIPPAIYFLLSLFLTLPSFPTFFPPPPPSFSLSHFPFSLSLPLPLDIVVVIVFISLIEQHWHLLFKQAKLTLKTILEAKEQSSNIMD